MSGSEGINTENFGFPPQSEIISLSFRIPHLPRSLPRVSPFGLPSAGYPADPSQHVFSHSSFASNHALDSRRSSLDTEMSEANISAFALCKSLSRSARIQQPSSLDARRSTSANRPSTSP